MWSAEKGAMSMMFHVALMSSISSYWHGVARSEESMLFASLYPLSHEIENADVQHIL